MSRLVLAAFLLVLGLMKLEDARRQQIASLFAVELAGGLFLLAVQPEVAGVGDGGLAPQDVGRGPENGVVYLMGGEFET